MSSIPDVSYTVGNLEASYDATTTVSSLTMTFDYSGVGDGRSTNDTSEEGIVSFEAIVYAYDSQEMHCSFFDAPLAMTSFTQEITHERRSRFEG